MIPFFDFNTSHVTVYHSLEYRLSYPVHYFNTSHVTVYQNDPAGARQRHAFQYISCYCLSKGSLWNIPTKQHFNTSHVTVYQGYHKAGKEVWDISIHLMLLFITPGQASAIRLIYISIHLMLLFINNETAQVAQEILFQYISCYCLSPSGCTTLVAVAPFQYISCYCLSVIRIAIAGADGYFNTSHVTVYRRYREPASNIVTDFNTSHVTVYHIRSIVCTTLYHISIHLMLLFINSPRPLAVWACYFNTSHVTVYPCSAKTSLPDLYHFNTSHVTVYLLHPPNNPYPLSISIHLMLLFIGYTDA